MDYQKTKQYTGCLIPAGLFLLVSGFFWAALFFSSTGFGWITLWAPPLLGFCAALLWLAFATPLHRRLLARELKDPTSPSRLVAWTVYDQDLPTEFSLGEDGALQKGRLYYWGHSLTLSLQDAILRDDPSGPMLVLKLCENLGRSNHYFDLDIPVPLHQRQEAERALARLWQAHTILNEDGHPRAGRP